MNHEVLTSSFKRTKNITSKKLVLTFGIILAGIVCMNAQDKAATKLVNHLTEVCALTPDQQTKLQPVAKDFIKTRKANKQQYANNPDSLKIANKANTRDYKAQLDAILTPDQQAKLKTYNAQKRANKQSGQGAGQEGEEQQQ